jgi:hypothetical protein
MRVNGPARLAVLSLVAASSLAVLAAPAQAVGTAVTPATAGNDGVKSFSMAGSSFVPAGQESVVLKANPAVAGQAAITGTVTSVAGCTGLPGMQTCTGPLLFDADLTNAAIGTYDAIETESDSAPPPVGAAPVVTTLVKAITVYAQPKFAATAPIAPAAVGQNNGLTVVTLKGTGFASGMTADFGAGVTVTGPLTVTADQKSAMASVMVDPAATVGTRDVTIANPSGTAATPVTKTAGFTVNAAPTVTDAAPASGIATMKQSVTFTGTGFVAGPDFKLNMADPSIVIENIKVVSATSVTADVTPGTASRKGLRAVNVVNPDGGAASKADAFTIVAPPGAPTAVAAQAGDTAVLVTWSAPADPGSGPVTGYRVTFTDGTTPKTTTVSSTAAFVPGLTNGTHYTFTVAAKNDQAVNGMNPVFGAESAPVMATPKFRTGLTSAVSANGRQAGTKLLASGFLNRYSGGTKGAPISGASVVVRYVPAVGNPYNHTVTTAADGNWKDALAPLYSVTFTASYAGTSSVAASTGKAVPVKVSAYVSLSSPRSSTSSAARSVLRVSGGVTPNKSGRTIGLYNGRTLIARTTVATNGSYLFNVRLAKGSYALHAGIGSTTGNVGGNSIVVNVKRT